MISHAICNTFFRTTNTTISTRTKRPKNQNNNNKVRQLNKLQRKELGQAAQYFHKLGHHQYAKETYLKMDDVKSLMELHVELHKWDEAFELVKMRPELAKDIYLPYAEWLAINDRFDEAQDAFKMAGSALFF